MRCTAAVREGKVIPVVATSSAKNVGYAALLNTIREMLPSPAEDTAIIGKSPAGEETARKTVPTEKFSAFVFKTLADPFVGKLSYVRVYSGTLHHNSQVYDATKGETERVGQISSCAARSRRSRTRSARRHLRDTEAHRHLDERDAHDKDAPILYDPIAFPPPSFSVAIDPASKADLDKMSTALHKLIDEDPSLHVRRDDATHETILSAVGESGDRRRGTPAQGEVRRAGRDAHAARAIPGIDPHEGIGAGPLQAPDRWPRAVRRRVARGRAAAAGIGRRLRYADRRRLGPAQLLAGRREGHPRAGAQGRDRGLPAVGLQGDVFDGSSTRSTRARCRSRSRARSRSRPA